MPNVERNPNLQTRNDETASVGVPLDLRISVFLRHSSFGFNFAPRLAEQPLKSDQNFSSTDLRQRRFVGTFFDIRHSDFSHSSPSLCRCEDSFERCHARISLTPSPWTSVRRRSAPLWRNVSFWWSMPSRCSTVA